MVEVQRSFDSLRSLRMTTHSQEKARLKKTTDYVDESPRGGRRGPLEQERNGRSRVPLAVVAGTLAIALCTVVSVTWLRRQAEAAWQAQVDLIDVEHMAAHLDGHEWQAIALREVSPGEAKEYAEHKREMLECVERLKRGPYQKDELAEFARITRQYIAAEDRELAAIEDDNYAEALKIDEQEADPYFYELDRKLDALDAGNRDLIRKITARSYAGLILAMLLCAGLINILFVRFERAQRIAEVARAQESGLRRSEERFRTLTEKSGDIILILDAGRTVRYVSPSVKSVLGVETSALAGQDLRRFVHEEDLAFVEASLEAAFSRNFSPTLEFRLQHRDGYWMFFEGTPRNLLGDPSIAGLVLNLRDIGERKRAEQELLFNAGHDSLTQLPNRASFLERLQSVIERTARHPEQGAAVLFVDIDDFKVINDSLGHEAGDELIVELGKRIKGSLRSGDLVGRPATAPDGTGTVARMGGDEFTVLLEDIRDPKDALGVAERIRAALEEPFVVRGHRLYRARRWESR